MTDYLKTKIINSYEEFYRYASTGQYGDYILLPFNDSYANRKQIEDCQMYVDGEKKVFSYTYTYN